MHESQLQERRRYEDKVKNLETLLEKVSRIISLIYFSKIFSLQLTAIALLGEQLNMYKLVLITGTNLLT